jgi:hypothetical protein
MSRCVVLAIVVLAGCHNACQGVCHEMAKAAKDCGIVVSDSEMQSCIDSQAKPTRPQRQACPTIDAETIATDWDCDEIGSYFGTTTSDTDRSDTDSP